MFVEAENSAEVLFECPECGRRVVFRRQGGMVILDRGDVGVDHFGGDLTVGVDLHPGSQEDV